MLAAYMYMYSDNRCETGNIYHRRNENGGLDVEVAGDLQPGVQWGGHEPTELRQEIEGYELEWITTQSPGDARKAAKEYRETACS